MVQLCIWKGIDFILVILYCEFKLWFNSFVQFFNCALKCRKGNLTNLHLKKIDLLNYVLIEKYNQREASDKFNVSTGTVSNIRKQSEELYKRFQEDASLRKFRKNYNNDNSKLNKSVLTWFRKARASNIPISGPILHDVAKQLAQELNVYNFSASNGWFDCLKKEMQLFFNY